MCEFDFRQAHFFGGRALVLRSARSIEPRIAAISPQLPDGEACRLRHLAAGEPRLSFTYGRFGIVTLRMTRTLTEGQRALIAEAGERERRATSRRGTECTELRLGAVVHCPLQIREVGPQSTELRMVGVDNLAGLGIGV
jgi:hypothetical protein